MPNRSIRLLIVDDTRSIRSLIRARVAHAPDIEVIGEAGDAFEAREMIRTLRPDVLTLDVEMPRMDGLSFLKRMMQLRPMPVVMISGHTSRNSDAAVQALSLGAVDCIDLGCLRACSDPGHVAKVVRIAATSTPRPTIRAANQAFAAESGRFRWNGKIVLIGASTGGVDALLTVLSALPEDSPPAVIAQHMPAPFLETFTARLDRLARPDVVPAAHGLRLRQGLICVSRGGGEHVAMSRDDPFKVRTVEASEADAYVPLVSELFSSALPHADDVVGVLLTGMGRDGAEALAALRDAGAHTIVQDGATAVVDGMPRAAREIGAASEVAALPDIAARVLAATSLRRRAVVRG